MAHFVNWKKIDRRILVLIAFALFAGIFDGLFGIVPTRYKIYPSDYQSFWGAYLSLYFFLTIVLLFGIKDKLKLLQATLLGFAFWGLGFFIHIFDAVRLGFIDQNKLMEMRFEFTSLFGTPITFSFYEIIALNLAFVIIAILIEVYRNKMRHM
jgi:hypothetical protein